MEHSSYAYVWNPGEHFCVVAASMGSETARADATSAATSSRQKHSPEFMSDMSSQHRDARFVLASRNGSLAHPESRMFAKAVTVHMRV